MIGLFLRKAFYSGWDNLLTIIVLNVLVLSIGFGGVFLASATADIVPLSIGSLVLAVLLEGVLFMSISSVMADVARHRSLTFKAVFTAFREYAPHGMFFAILVCLVSVLAAIVIPYYLSLNSLFGLTLAAMMFWVVVLFLLSFQWFLAVRVQIEKDFKNAVKKSFILFFDNPGFSFFLFFYSLVLITVSGLTVFLVPGFSGVILAQNEALRLRLFKYNWIESHPELDFKTARKSVPWDEILEEEDDIVGHRTFRNFIFPWKY